jgi:hypothetical protein
VGQLHCCWILGCCSGSGGAFQGLADGLAAEQKALLQQGQQQQQMAVVVVRQWK